MLFRILEFVVPPVARAIWRPIVVGRDNVPRSGGVLLASNHLSFADSVVIPVCAPRNVAFLAKQEYFQGTGIKGALQRGWFEGLNMLPIDRDDTRAAITSLELALELLAAAVDLGEVVVGQLAPFLFDLAGELLPVAFDAIPVHAGLHCCDVA